MVTLTPYEVALLPKATSLFNSVRLNENRVVSKRELREALHCGNSKAQRIRQYLIDEGKAPAQFTREKNVITGDSWDIELPKTTIHTLDQLVSHCKVDLNVWEVERFVVNKWEVVMKPAAYTELFVTKDGREIPMWQRGEENTDPLHEPLYQVKAFLKKKNLQILVRAELEALKEEFKKQRPPVAYLHDNLPTNGLMLEVAIFDLHFGKQSWPAETLDKPYDIKIAEAMFFRALDKIIERSSGFKYEKVLFVVGQDLLHSNDLESRTANGTIVDSDGRFQKAYVTARKAMVEAIERLKQIAPVEVLVVVGNHDKFSAWTLGDSLECYFHNDPNVTISNSPSLRKYVQWGQVGLMVTHGDEGKRQDYPLLFATEKPLVFGNTQYREVHTGHNHTTKTEEFHGVRVRIISSLSTADAWHASKGFKGALRTAESFVWSKDEGLIAQYTYTDNAYPTIYTKRQLYVEGEE